MKGKPKKLLLGGLVLVQVVSAVLAWRDMGSRSNDQVRGSKKTWRGVIVLNPGNSFGYWIFGRERGPWCHVGSERDYLGPGPSPTAPPARFHRQTNWSLPALG